MGRFSRARRSASSLFLGMQSVEPGPFDHAGAPVARSSSRTSGNTIDGISMKIRKAASMRRGGERCRHVPGHA